MPTPGRLTSSRCASSRTGIGSTAGPADAPVTIDVRSPKALSYVATATGNLGLARAYVTGELE